MQDLPTGPSEPRQLQMQFDSKRLRGLTPQEREQAVMRLAILLVEAAGPTEREESDNGR